MYEIIFEKKAEKQFNKLSSDIKRRISEAIDNKLVKNPDKHLISLIGNMSGFYKFRVGDYRLICKKDSKELIVIVLKISHRKDVYN